MTQQQIPSEKFDAIVAAVNRGDVAGAVDMYREALNCDHAQAGNVVGALQKALGMAGALGNTGAGGANTTRVTGTTTSFSMTINGVALPADIAAKIRDALRNGDEAGAAALYQNAANVSPAQAKSAISTLAKMHALAPAPGPQPQPVPQAWQAQLESQTPPPARDAPAGLHADDGIPRRQININREIKIRITARTLLLVAVAAACVAWWLLARSR